MLADAHVEWTKGTILPPCVCTTIDLTSTPPLIVVIFLECSDVVLGYVYLRECHQEGRWVRSRSQ